RQLLPCLYKLNNVDTFTKLDMWNAYGNLRVAEGNEDKLAFICRA
ncbi:uncharacterized protein VP01_8068g1, partial [Puccinia sorghi]